MPAGARQLTPDPGRRLRAGAAVAEPYAAQAGSPIGGSEGSYILERRIGESPVWRAIAASGQPVAVKTGPREAIEREYRILSRLQHPGIVTVLDRIEPQGSKDSADSSAEFGIVFEYLSGGDLVSLAGAAPAHWLRAGAELIDALACLHRSGYVHRDIKARNVLISEDGSTRLIDFGSALPAGSPFTRGGTTLVAPARGDGPVAVDDDIFSLSALFFELLFGRTPEWPPFIGAGGAGATEVMLPAVKPEVPEACRELMRLVRRGLAVGAGLARPRLEQYGAVMDSMRDQPGAHG